MSSLATITARIDEQDKTDFNAFCGTVGLNISTAVNLFVKAVLRENRIPFDISGAPDPFYSKSNMARLKESEQQFREGKVVVKTMEELEAMANG